MKDTKKKITIRNIFWYLQGNTRYKLMKTPLKFLVPKYIREQIELRKASANSICMGQFSCKECGCSMPQMVYADKECYGSCYPRLLTKKEYTTIKTGSFFCDLHTQLIWIITDGKFKPINLPK